MAAAFDFDEEERACELCGSNEELVICEGLDVCTPCAKKHGLTLAEYSDELREDLG